MDTFAEYERLAKLTQPTNGCDAVLHGCHGLSSEVGELAACALDAYTGRAVDLVNVIEEAGDLLWYLTRLIGGIDLTLQEVADCHKFSTYEEVVGLLLPPNHKMSLILGCLVMTQEVSSLHDGLKRELAYGAPRAEYLQVCRDLLESIANIAYYANSNLEAVATANIAKLALRSAELRADPALRDTAEERQAIQREVAAVTYATST